MKYEGKVFQHSPFAMFDNRFDKFRIVWGLRAEYYEYKEISNPNDGRIGVNNSLKQPEEKNGNIFLQLTLPIHHGIILISV